MADDVAYVAKLLAAPIAQYTHQNPSRPAPTREHPRSNGRNTHRTETHIFRNDTSGRGKPRSPSTGKPPHSREQHPPHRSAGRTEVTTSQKRARSQGSSPGASSKGRAAAEQLLPRGCSNKKGHLQCDWCNCQVGHGDRAWLTHVAGIQHRRETLSVQLYGEPGHMVISQFEPLPARGADTATRAMKSATEAVQALHMTDEEFKQLMERTRAAIRLEMRNHCSLDDYAALSKRFDTLEVQLRSLLAELGMSESASCTVKTSLPAKVAAAAAAVQASPVLALSILVEECVLSKPMLAALGYLARSIQNSPALETVSVSCAHDSLMLSCCERGHARAMTKFLHAARDQLSARCVLRSISVAVPKLPDSCPCHNRSLSSMQEKHQEMLESAVHSLKGVLLEANQRRRSALAMSIHPRCSERQCALHRLPAHLIKYIADLMGPPCAVSWQYV